MPDLLEAERDAQQRLDDLIAARDAEPDKRKRKQLSQRVKLMRSVRDWIRASNA
jgi:hypothetical protein